MMSEPRPSSPQSKAAAGEPPEPTGRSLPGLDGSIRTSSQTTHTFLASGLRYFQPARLLPLNSGFQPSLLEYCAAGGCGGAAGAAAVPARNASMTTEQIS